MKNMRQKVMDTNTIYDEKVEEVINHYAVQDVQK